MYLHLYDMTGHDVYHFWQMDKNDLFSLSHILYGWCDKWQVCWLMEIVPELTDLKVTDGLS